MALRVVGVTGATGMLGRHIIADLKCHQIRTVSVSRSRNRQPAQSDWDLMFWGNFEMFDELFSGVTEVVHAGAYVPRGHVEDEPGMFDANVRACFNLSEWAKARSVRLIFVSGAIVYKNPYADQNYEESMVGFSDLAGLYEWSKIMAEDILLRQAETGLKLSIIRPTSIYGYGLDNTKIVSQFLTTATNQEEIRIKQPVMDGYDLIHAADVASAVTSVITKNVDGIFNVGMGEAVSLKKLAKSCVKAIGAGSVIEEHSNSLTRTPRTLFSVNFDKAVKQLEWRPKVSLELGLQRMMEEQCL